MLPVRHLAARAHTSATGSAYLVAGREVSCIPKERTRVRQSKLSLDNVSPICRLDNEDDNMGGGSQVCFSDSVDEVAAFLCHGPQLSHLHPSTRIGGVPLRVAGLAVWPGVIRPASRSDALVGSIDVFPTLARIAGVQLPSGTEGGSSCHEIGLEGRLFQCSV